MQEQALKWQPVTTKACGMVFTSLFQLSFSPWSPPRHLKFFFFLHVSCVGFVRQVRGKPKLLDLNQAVNTWTLAWQLNGCSNCNLWCQTHKRSSQGIVVVTEQVQWAGRCGSGEKSRQTRGKTQKAWIILSNQGFCSAGVHSALFLYPDTGWEDFTFWVSPQSVSSPASRCVTFLF